MGTNYYAHKDCCKKCGRSSEKLHIGKSSGGWCFSLHVDHEIKSLADWQEVWNKPGVTIKDEYDEIISKHDMLATIINREGAGFDRDGSIPYNSWEQFHEQNNSEPGPNGLLRHKIGPYCLAHGDGTYDLIPGEFS